MNEVAERESDIESELAVDGGSAALALALGGVRDDPRLAGDIAGFLADQRRLITAQLAHLHVQFTHLKLRHWGERLRLTLQALTVLVGVVLFGAVLALAWQASRANGVVVEAFSTPPDLASRGLNGEVLASQLEDRLNALQAATFSERAGASYSNNWGHDIKVEIPETGVSVDQLQRFLRGWLGHETRVGGEAFRTKDGLSLTVRVAEAGGDTVSGTDDDLASLVSKAAEAVYGRTQPYRYGAYL